MARKRKPAAQPQSFFEEEEEELTEANEKEEEEEDEEEEESDDDEEEVEEEEEAEEEEEEEADEEEEDLSSREAIKKLLEPFGKDQLIELLKEAALKNPSIITRISESAESDPVHRKIFVHGLGWDATTETLASTFSQYGEIEECKVVVDRVTGRSKGYGFVLFRTRNAARKALKEPQKKIGNRLTSCQLASFGAPSQPVPEATGRKVFVSNLSDNVNPDRLRSFFSKFGEIEDGPLGYDRTTGKLRGFAIFVYKTAEGCKKALEEPKKVFEGCELNCQRALEGIKPKPAFPSPAGGIGILQPALQPNDLALTYASASMMGMNQVAGLAGQNFVGQNPGVGLLNPAAGFSPSLGRSGMTPPSYGVNTISPSVIGSYGSQAALQGMGAYQSSQLSANPATKSQQGIGSYGTGLPPYLGR